MAESEFAVTDFAQHGSATQQQIAARVLEGPAAWQKWESKHYSLTRPIAHLMNPCFDMSNSLRTTFTAFAKQHFLSMKQAASGVAHCCLI
ncbi:MAG: hypothetical protein R3E77_05480 [Steroidobacteraceae bacterium]